MFLKISRGLFGATALCSFANGVAYLFFPVASLALLGVQPDNYGLVITRYYGACALGLGWLLWWARSATQVAHV
jgi:phosphate/sulfate permease